MKFAVDLHIHSCLSPCADADMTPNNIVNMALIKGLDMIAVSDHNTARQLPAIAQVARAAGLALLPAIELTTREEAHLLAYFKTVEQAISFSDYIYPYLPPVKNKPGLFGEQLELNAEDEFVRAEERLLISALSLSVDELCESILSLGGLAVPAHINRGANGILTALGFLPPNIQFSALEVALGLPLPHTGMPDLKHLHSSDAHYLENIYERQEFIELPECTPAAFFDWIKSDVI